VSNSTAKKTPGTRAETPKPAAKPATKAAAKPKAEAAPAKSKAAPPPTHAPAPPAAAATRPPAKTAASSKAAASPPMPKASASQTPPPAATAPSDRPKPVSAQRPVVEPSLIDRPARKIDPKLAGVWKNKAGRELTDEEVLAMPDSEYMGDKQQEFFRAKLELLKSDLLSNAGETTEHLREDTSIVPDPADRATIEEEHALELRTRDRERKLLKKITQAIARIDTGEYGFCDETGEPIGLGRLIARPTATLTLEAQQRRELKQKMYGD
jgi:DnaK suppressor protein